MHAPPTNVRCIADARQVFERWMRWEPDHHGWMAYIKFELRGGDTARARGVYERYVVCLPTAKAWVRYAKFEAEHGDLARSRNVYERALQVGRLLLLLLCCVRPSNLPRCVAMLLCRRAVPGLSFASELPHCDCVDKLPGMHAVFLVAAIQPAHTTSYNAQCIRHRQRFPLIPCKQDAHKRLDTHKAAAAAAQSIQQYLRKRTVPPAQVLEDEEDTEDLYINFADFEVFCKEHARARAIFKYALDHVPKGRAEALYAKFVTFEKQHGDRESIEEVLSAKKRLQVRPVR